MQPKEMSAANMPGIRRRNLIRLPSLFLYANILIIRRIIGFNDNIFDESGWRNRTPSAACAAAPEAPLLPWEQPQNSSSTFAGNRYI